MNLTGGGAFYSQTPKSYLEDLQGVNKGGNEVPDQSYSSEARVSSRLENELEINQKLDPQTQRFENDVVCHSERSEELQSLANIVSKKILKRVQDDCLSSLSKVRYDKKLAFTLAEVLITLGIVGIIAAMTLPMLAENYQRRIVETRLKKFYTTFNQAIIRSVVVNGDYDKWAYLEGATNREVIDQNFSYYLKPYLNIVQIQEIIYTNGKSSALYYLADGSAFHYSPTTIRDIYYYPKDPVKCLKRTNVARVGVCQFNFCFVPNILNNAPEYSLQWKYHIGKGLEPFKYSWDGTLEYFYADKPYSCHPNAGSQCSALIQYNDWQIPKDYPRKIRY